MAGIRTMLGVCAQPNILTTELTCYDHLRLFAELKGIESSVVDDAVCYGCDFNIFSCCFLNCSVLNQDAEPEF